MLLFLIVHLIKISDVQKAALSKTQTEIGVSQ